MTDAPLVTALWLLLAAVLVISVVTDLLSRRILDVLTYPAMAIALLARFVFSRGTFELHPALGTIETGFVSGAVAALGSAAIFALFAWRGTMGWGDVKLIALVGAVMGFHLAQSALVRIALVGAVQAIVFLIWHGKTGETFGALLRRWAVKARLVSKDGAPETERQHIPYALAIAIGSFWAIWRDAL